MDQPDTGHSINILSGHDETVGDPPALVDIPHSVGQLQGLYKPPILVPQSEPLLQCADTPPRQCTGQVMVKGDLSPLVP